MERDDDIQYIDILILWICIMLICNLIQKIKYGG